MNKKEHVDILHTVNLCTYFHDISQVSVGQMIKKITLETCFTCMQSANF